MKAPPPAPSTETIPMRPEEHRLLSTLLQERTGLVFGADSARHLERRLAARVEALDLTSFSAYHRYLRTHPGGEDELQHVYDLVTNNETYFFREDYQFQVFREQILPRLAREARGRRNLTCWSMGCSTGEEAYSIAMVVLESGLCDSNVRVYGTDLSRRCVVAARRGVYGDNAFRSTSPERRARFFVPARGGVRVAPPVREMCHFVQHNLLALDAKTVIDQVDVVFCRNVLIYFEPDVRRRVIWNIYARLRPGGYLMLGHSESLLHESSPFVAVHLGRDVVYRRLLMRSSRPPVSRRRLDRKLIR
jgi:chemotaxis protein methyltransferase CheR